MLYKDDQCTLMHHQNSPEIPTKGQEFYKNTSDWSMQMNKIQP